MAEVAGKSPSRGWYQPCILDILSGYDLSMAKDGWEQPVPGPQLAMEDQSGAGEMARVMLCSRVNTLGSSGRWRVDRPWPIHTEVSIYLPIWVCGRAKPSGPALPKLPPSSVPADFSLAAAAVLYSHPRGK